MPDSAAWGDHLWLVETSVKRLVATLGEDATRRILSRAHDAMLARRV